MSLTNISLGRWDGDVAAPRGTTAARSAGASALFVFIFLFSTMSAVPFESLAEAGGFANALNQVVAAAMMLGVIAYVARLPNRSMMLQPRLLILGLLGWMAIASMLGPDAGAALRRLFISLTICIGAGALLLLPRNQSHFAGLLAASVLTILGLSYIGVLLLPDRAIHQATDLVEPTLAGDWRGVFNHKNFAAPAMVVIIFCGLYLKDAWSRRGGWLIVALAAFFLWQTGGKTAAAMLPVVLGFVFLIERRPGAAPWLVLGGLVLMNTLTVGAAVSEPIRAFVASLGIDPTFTARADIWNLSLNAVLDQPLTGFGFQSFWQTGLSVDAGGDYASWAVTASHAHNAYIETLLNAGIPGFVLTIIWLILLPLRDFRRAAGGNNNATLTRLFTRIWVFAILTACLESIFFTGIGPIWFSALFAVFGLRLQGRAHLVSNPDLTTGGQIA